MLTFLLISVAVVLTGASDGIDLTDSDFASRIKEYDLALVDFFAPWCGQCKRLAPEYESAAITILKNDPPIRLFKVDCTESGKETCSKYGVSGYPDLRIFEYGKLRMKYDGPRDSSGIVTYMKKKASPVKHLKDLDHATLVLKAAEKPMVIGFFEKDDADLREKFRKAVNEFNGMFTFAYSSNKDINAGLKHNDEIVLYRPRFWKNKYEDSEVVYKSGDILQFIKNNIFGLCGIRDYNNQKYFKTPLVVVYYEIDFKRNPKGSKHCRDSVLKLAKKFIGKNVNFAVSKRGEYSRMLDDYGLVGSSVNAIATNNDGQNFVMAEEFDEETLERFVQNFLDGNLEPYMKSDPVPEHNDGPVKEVVAITFNKIVNDPTKDVLIEFYAPWCGHCKRLEPKYNELGETLKDEKSIVIARFDATTNDVPLPYHVHQFPTIYFVPVGSKSHPQVYNGGRELEDFLAFLRKMNSLVLSYMNIFFTCKNTLVVLLQVYRGFTLCYERERVLKKNGEITLVRHVSTTANLCEHSRDYSWKSLSMTTDLSAESDITDVRPIIKRRTDLMLPSPESWHEDADAKSQAVTPQNYRIYANNCVELIESQLVLSPVLISTVKMLTFLLISVAVVLTGASDVIDLTDSDFASRIKEYDLALVDFFAPWCGHCKRLAPEYETAATKLRTNDPPIRLFKVDCTESGKETCSKYGVPGYPDLRIFESGKLAIKYDGPRDSDGIVGYMKKKASPVKHLKDITHATRVLEEAEKPMVIGFFENDDADLREKFRKAVNEFNGVFTFAYSSNKDINAGLKHNDEIVLYRPEFWRSKSEDSEVVYKSGDILQFIKNNIFGLCGIRDYNNQKYFKTPLVVVYYEIDYKRNPKGSRYWRNRVLRVAKKFIGKNVNFAVSRSGEYSKMLDDYGLVESSVNAIATNNDGQNFVMAEEFDVETLERFVQNFLDGNLEPYIKSESVPKHNDGPVKKVVAITFNEIVNDPTKDVLIEFYAPWCGHCKSLEPKFNELGETFKDEKSIVIAKFDATANDVPLPYHVHQFPTIYFVPVGSKSHPQVYNGGRELEDFLAFLPKVNSSVIKTKKGRAAKAIKIH
ncbi:protein disulfide-isomerase A4-like [Tubulanus polymorphus]|uniref:protein disulfide-isomerase A4-like n=1 Tax=Tubulanus polymorphus TaxID=672921 RepID=UPI003DA50E62